MRRSYICAVDIVRAGTRYGWVCASSNRALPRNVIRVLLLYVRALPDEVLSVRTRQLLASGRLYEYTYAMY